LYVFGKQTLREISLTFQKDKRTLRAVLHTYVPKQKTHTPRPVHVTVDATYFGMRLEHTAWCVAVARDASKGENLWWTFTTRETTSVYLQMRTDLESLGYTLLSVTGDGFGGIKQGFLGIPYQMCQVHMQRIVTKGTTKSPKLEAGKVLLALTKTLSTTTSHTFRTRLNKYLARYTSFLNERSVNPETGVDQWTHEPLRQAVFSLVEFEKYLFTFEQIPGTPKTTNSLEGHFRHINEVVAIHCGLARTYKEKVIHTILLAGTIAPTEEKMKEIL
jgi:hypothetical protein